jgi:hypothetical protein
MVGVLTSLLKADAVPFATLHARYGGLLELVRAWIGVVPNCDPYLEIWAPAFRTYNVMVPNFLNLPLLVRGVAAPRHDFPVLARLTHRRTIRALATRLRDNLDAKTSVIGVARKLDAGAIYARAVGDGVLEAQLRKLGVPERDARVEALARAIAPSPAVVDERVVDVCRDLPPAAIIELVAFVSLVQLWHRVETFYAA